MLDADTSPKPPPLLPQPRLSEPRSGRWRLDELDVVEEIDPALGAEAYRLEVVDGRALIAASDARGFRHARVTLSESAVDGFVSGVIVEDAPTLRRRGVIEGFYGEPWSHAERLDFLRLAGRLKLNSYVYAPKDDPYHRVQWRDPYPEAELAQLVALAREGAEHGVDVVVALHPAGSMVFSDEAEHALLAAKAGQLLDAGVPSVALLFDDVPRTPNSDADKAHFGEDEAALGRAHALTAQRFLDDALRSRRPDADLFVVAMDYPGVGTSDYRVAFSAGLPSDAYVWWTGRDIVVGEITRADIDAAAEVFGDRLLLWDNFPVNDFDRGRAFLGPLLGRTRDVEGSALHGAWSNPMVEYAPGCFGIAAFADWAWNPAAYDPDRAASAALGLVGGEDAAALAPLVRTLSSWPPSAPMDTELAALAQGVLDADVVGVGVRAPGALAGDAAGAFRARLSEFVALGAVSTAREPARSLAPWLAAAMDMAAAGLAALDVLEGAGDRASVSDALARAEAHTAKVATDVIPAFVREVLARSAP